MERFVRMAFTPSREEIGRLLAEHPLIQGMDQDHLAMIAPLAEPVHFESGKYVFQEGQSADRLFLILHGAVTLEVFNLDPGSIPLQTVCDGEVLGWSWFVPPYTWRFDAKAVQATDALVFDVRKLLELCEEHTDLGYDFMRRMAAIVEQRLSAAKDQLVKNYAFHR